jgi:hypothetical protein
VQAPIILPWQGFWIVRMRSWSGTSVSSNTRHGFSTARDALPAAPTWVNE